jgi:hypothetical protein
MGDAVTLSPPAAPAGTPVTVQSLLPFAESELMAMRMLPAEFARAVGVSKQSVSRWVKAGKVTLFADGRLNPVVALRQVIRHSEPGQLRARWLRLAMDDLADLRAQAARASDLQQLVADLRRQLADEQVEADAEHERFSAWIVELKEGLAVAPLEIRQAMDQPAWRAHVEGVLSAVMADDEADDVSGLDQAFADLCGGVSFSEPIPSPGGAG